MTQTGASVNAQSFTVAPGNMDSVQHIQISRAANPIATEVITFSFTPEGLTFDTTNGTPTFVVQYTDTFLQQNGIADPAQIRVASRNAVSGIIEMLPVVAVDALAKTVTVEVPHFSILSFFGSATQPTGFAQVLPELPGPLKFYPLLPDSANTERTLVLVHGICSSAEELIACPDGLLAVVKKSPILSKQYDRVFIFQYPWKRGFNGPPDEKNVENRPAEFWQRALSAVSGPLRTIDIIGHSMGGCVSRYALEIVDADLRARAAVRTNVMIATPSGGVVGGTLQAIRCQAACLLDVSCDFQAAVDLSPPSIRLGELAHSQFNDFSVRYVTIAGDVVSTGHDVFIPPALLGVAVTSVELGEQGSTETKPQNYEHFTFKGKPGAFLDTAPAGHSGLHCRAAEDATIGAFADITSNVSRTISVSSSNAASVLVTILRDPEIETIIPSQGPPSGGTEIAIAGVNFFNVTSVTTGGSACTDIAVNPAGDRVTCKTPASGAAGAADVIIASSTHRAATKKGGFLYTITLQPTSWIKLSPSSSPRGRFGHALASDLKRRRAVLFGGVTNNLDLSGDTWEFDGTTWIERTPSRSPSARRQYAMTYDSVRSRVILFGGTIDGATANFDDTWEWDGATWTQRFPAVNPPARFYHAMIYDARRDRVVLFGGSDTGGSYRNDTWEWDGTTWTQRFPVRSPSVRFGHSMAYDSVRGQVVLFGGEDEKKAFNDTWEWDGDTWEEKIPDERPAERVYAGTTFDPLRGRTVLFGGLPGTTSPSFFDDTWEWNGTRWSRLSLTTSPSRRFLHTMWFDEPNGVVMFFGGSSNAIPLSRLAETWQLSP